MKVYVVGFLFSSNKDRVVLILKNKPEWQRGFLNGVGGTIEEGETPLEAMVREFEEETGVVTSPTCWTLFCESYDPINDIRLFLFKCFDPSDFIKHVKTMETEKVGVYSIEFLYDNWIYDNPGTFTTTVPNLKTFLPMALNDDFHQVKIKCKLR